MREFKCQNELDHKMSVGYVYAGYCCVYHANSKRWNKWKGINNSKRKTLRTHRTGIIK